MTHANYNRRFRSQKKSNTRKPTRKLVCFEVAQVQYAIAIEKVQRVLKEFTPYGSLTTGQSLVRYHDELITLIDVSKLLLNSQLPGDSNYLIVCLLTPTEKLGIPISEMPRIMEFTEDNFGEIPELYRHGKLPQAVEKVILTADGKEIFYLNLGQIN
jgi:chemotaxis signal transduction protein